MLPEFVHTLLARTEGINLEFKEARNGLPDSFFETVCSFLNREGGIILLGVTDKGAVTGVPAHLVESVKANIINLTNNQQKLDPPFIIMPDEVMIEGKVLILAQVPVSSRVHRCKGIVFDRAGDGDYHITEPDRIADLVNRKSHRYSEVEIYTGLRFSDFNSDLFHKVRNLIRSKTPAHPWLAIGDEEMLVKAGFYRRDLQSGTVGYTLGAGLMFGKDEVIQSIAPYYKVDALVRKTHIDRYDDRLYIQTNLIDTFDLLMGFVTKHLSDRFYLEGDLRISLLEKIFREVVSNLIVHREYNNASPTIFTIFKDRVEVVNANNPNVLGKISPAHFSPYPKNPVIAKFFMQLGRFDELGSGVINVNKYLPLYCKNAFPTFEEEVNTFRTLIPLEPTTRYAEYNGELSGELSGELNGELNGELHEPMISLFKKISEHPGIQAKELAQQLHRPFSTVDKQIRALAAKQLVIHKGSRKTGGYYRVDK